MYLHHALNFSIIYGHETELYFILCERENPTGTKVTLFPSSIRSENVGTCAHGIAGVITCRLTSCIGINDDKSVATHAIVTVTGDYFFSRQPAISTTRNSNRLEQSDVSWKSRFLRCTNAMFVAQISSALINA